MTHQPLRARRYAVRCVRVYAHHRPRRRHAVEYLQRLAGARVRPPFQPALAQSGVVQGLAVAGRMQPQVRGPVQVAAGYQLEAPIAFRRPDRSGCAPA